MTRDLTGRQFGRLTVLERAEKSEKGAAQWKCACDCGRECIVLQSSLRSGKRTSCGCDSRKGRHTARDLSGQRFGLLTALYPTSERRQNGAIVWHCRCDCGNEANVPMDRLKAGSVISCGCMRKKCGEELAGRLTHVAGTSIDALRSGRLRPDNHSGVTGVRFRRGKYSVSITFQQKTYYLGSYAGLEAAAQVRREAEELLHRGSVRFYEAWKRRADGDPAWAEQNPILIRVRRGESGEFRVEMLPDMDGGRGEETEYAGSGELPLRLQV